MKLCLAASLLVVVEGLYVARDVVPHQPVDELETFLAKDLSEFMALGVTNQASKDQEGFKPKCLKVAKAVAFANGGSKTKADRDLAIRCSRYTYAPRTKACNIFRETLQKHMHSTPAWNLARMDYGVFCDGFYKALGVPFVSNVKLEGVSKVTVLECANTAKKMFAKMPTVFSVGSTLVAACSNPDIQKEVGGDEEHCEQLMLKLAEQNAGKKDYFPWCRALKMQSPGYLKSVLDDLMKDPNITAGLNACSEHCPQISKMIRNFAMMKSISTDLLDVMMKSMQDMGMGPPPKPGDSPPKPPSFTDMIKKNIEMQEEISGHTKDMNQVSAQMCDFKTTAKCTPGTLHKTCSDTLEMIAPFTFQFQLNMVWEQCTLKEPCNDVCPGVQTKGFNFFGSTNMLKQKRMVMATGLAEDAKASCKSLDSLQKCTSKPACVKFLSNTPVAMLLPELRGGGGMFAPPPMPPGMEPPPGPADDCKVYSNPCFAKTQAQCKAQLDAAYSWKDDLGMPWNQCPSMFIIPQGPPGTPPPPVPPRQLTPEQKTQCCGALTNLAKCMESQGCGDFHNTYLEFVTERNFPPWYNVNATQIYDACKA